MIRPIVLAVVMSFCTVSAGPAVAHDWYPIECCHQRDCAPIVREVQNEDGSITLATKFGVATVPQNFPIRSSRDEQSHACIIAGKESMHVRCLFRPAGS